MLLGTLKAVKNFDHIRAQFIRAMLQLQRRYALTLKRGLNPCMTTAADLRLAAKFYACGMRIPRGGACIHNHHWIGSQTSLLVPR